MGHGGLVRLVDIVPNTETALVLCDHHIALRDPLYIGAVGEEGGVALGLHIVEMQLQPPVSEQQLASRLIELQTHTPHKRWEKE